MAHHQGLNYYSTHSAGGRDVTHIQDVLLNHRVEDDGDEEIEEDGGAVFPAVMVESQLSV